VSWRAQSRVAAVTFIVAFPYPRSVLFPAACI
jgi:hypothetical protein